jgi:hypothetical protein
MLFLEKYGNPVLVSVCPCHRVPFILCFLRFAKLVFPPFFASVSFQEPILRSRVTTPEL